MENREIKFRAWVKFNIKNIMIYQNDMDLGSYFDHKIGDFDYDLMQYIGKKDKKKKEIYEGDICEIPDFYPDIYAENGDWKERYENTIGEIKFIDGCFMFCDHQEIPLHAIDIKDIEIIGNIYENPELLKT